MSYTNVLKPVAFGLRKATTRLAPYVFSVGGYAVLFWGAYLVVVLFIENGSNQVTMLAFLKVLLVSGFGVLFTILTALGFRFLKPRVQRVGYRFIYEIICLLVLSVAWWVIKMLFSTHAELTDNFSMYSLLMGNWAFIPMAALIFITVYIARNFVDTKIETHRRKAFDLLPKALAVSDQLDAFDIIAGLNELKQVYGKSRLKGEHFLEYLNYEIKLSLDPRYSFPMPLPTALGFLLRELTFRRQIQSYNVVINMRPRETFPAEFTIEPEILCAVGGFIVEYGSYHSIKSIVMNIYFREDTFPCIEFRTNILIKDLWFVLDEQSSAQKSKVQLFKVLNRYVHKGIIFLSTQDPKGFLLFQVSVQADLKTKQWDQVEKFLGENVHFLAQSVWAKDSSRTYGDDNSIYKVQLIGLNNVKPLILAEEYNILRRLQGIDGIPQSPHFKQHSSFAILSYGKIHGIPIKQYLAKHDFDRREWFYIITDLSVLMNNIHEKGILHRDLSPDNILLREDGRVCLIDFDQAVAGAYAGQQVDTTGKRFGAIPPCVSVPRLIELLDLQDEYMTVTKELKSAWSLAAQSKASSPGRNLAYYHWIFGDVELPGERDWFERWNLIYKAVRNILPGASILELGCNMGLLASHCILYGARHVTAVDIENDILEAGVRLAKTAGLEIEFLQGDLNSQSFVDSLLERDYDIIVALSVIHWLKKPEEALRLLSHAPRILFEGHDPPPVEMKMLHELGFKDIKLIGYSERLRALYLASKEGI